MSRPVVAIDVGPLIGPRTGIGEAVTGMIAGLEALAMPTLSEPAVGHADGCDVDDDGLDIESTPILAPYVTSFRAPRRTDRRRLPIPAAVAQRWWARFDGPPLDRWLGRPDVVHGTNYVVPPSRAPRVVSVYDCWFLQHPSEVHPDVRRAGDVLRRSVAGGAVVHASSHATAARVRDLLDTDRVEVIHLGAPVVPCRNEHGSNPGRAPEAPTAARSPVVLALGTVERRKNLPALVTAFGLARRSIPQLRLVIAGSAGDDQVAVERALDRLTVQDREAVELAGRVDDIRRAALLDEATLLAYPSLDEGFGFPLLEAMGVGVPVVGSTAGSIPELAGDAALLVDPADTAGLAAALVRVCTEPELAASMIERGHHQTTMFAWSATAKRLSALYARLAMDDFSPARDAR